MRVRHLLAILGLAGAAALAPAAHAQRWSGGAVAVPPPGPSRGGAVVVQGGWNNGWNNGWNGSAWRAPAPAWGWSGGVAWGRPGWGWGGSVAWGRPVGWGWGGWGWGWGPAWGWGWGPGWAWGPGWGWGAAWTTPVFVTAPAVTTGAWVLPPAASTVYIERGSEVAPPPAAPAPQQWWYWCESARAYYPYVQSCAEAWRRVEPRVPANAQ